jgi:hypothetical protein
MKNTLIIIILMFILNACSRERSSSTDKHMDFTRMAILGDFEQLAEQIRWEGTYSISEEYHSHGYSSCELSGPPGQALWLEATDMPVHWSDFEFLKFDIYNPSSHLYYGNIQIFDAEGTDEEAEFKGQSYLGEGKLFLNTGWNHFEFKVQNAMVEEGNRHLDIDKIRKLRMSFGVTEKPLYIDNIRLTGATEPAAGRSVTKPEDCTIVIDNRSVYTTLTGPADQIKINPEIIELRKRAVSAVNGLKTILQTAELQGLQSLYQKIPLITADIGMNIRSNLVWFQNEDEQRKILEYVISSCSEAARELEEILFARQTDQFITEPENEVSRASFYVSKYPPMNELKSSDGVYTDKSGNPVLVLSMLQVNEGPLMDYFAPFNHRLESYTVGGGSRYTIEFSPVYEAFHKYPDTHRVGWDGWCGHLIKDRWSMGGKKEDVVICLESGRTREAVLKYIRMHQSEWANNPGLLYNIMAYELQYICYCETSQRMFRDWLMTRYKSIDNLNRIWKTGYRSFAETTAPATHNARPADNVNRAAWYDWAEFNSVRFTGYMKWIKDEMRKYDTKTPICAGGTSSMLSSSNSVTGIDEELIINEIDDVILNESGGSAIFSDLLLSLSETKKVMVDPEMGGGTHGLLLQFLHGKSDISKWWWAGMPSREYPHMNETSLPHSKEISLQEIAEVLKIGLDIRRLGKELAEFTKPDPEVVILYSRSSIVQVPPQLIQSGSTPYTMALTSVWEGSRYLGCRVGFITEKQILQKHLEGIKLLLVPAVKYIRPEVIPVILNFIQRSGIVLIIPESFLYDQYARENDLIKDFGITINDVTLPPETGKGEKVHNYDQSFSQSVLYGEVRKKISCEEGDVFVGKALPGSLKSDGLVQTIDPGPNRVLARFEDGRPALILIKKGEGRIYYLAAPLETGSYHQILFPIADLAGINRPVIAVGKNGNPVTGAEIRGIELETEYLAYACNLTGSIVEFDLDVKGAEGDILDLRTMKNSTGRHVVLSPYQETIFRLEKKGKN